MTLSVKDLAFSVVAPYLASATATSRGCLVPGLLGRASQNAPNKNKSLQVFANTTICNCLQNFCKCLQTFVSISKNIF
jgi:hypothetical protein